MASISIAKERALKRGDAPLANGFSGVVREPGTSNYVDGEIFKIPDPFDVYEQKIPNPNNPSKPTKAEYCFVETCDSTGKLSGSVKRFYPGLATRARIVCNEDGSLTGNTAINGGYMAETINKESLIQDAFRKMAGKYIRVKDVETINTFRFGSNEVIKAKVQNFDEFTPEDKVKKQNVEIEKNNQ